MSEEARTSRRFIDRLPKRLSLLAQSHFTRNVLALAGGTAIGQLVVILATPIVTRLYTPSEFGVFAVYMAVFMVVAALPNLRYELAVALPPSAREGSALVALCLLLSVGTAALVGGGAVLARDQIAQLLNTPELGSYLWILVPSICITGIYLALLGWTIRQQDFSSLASTRLRQGVGKAATQVALGVAGLGPGGLIAGGIIGQSAGVFALATRARRSGLQLPDWSEWHRVVALAKRYRRFPMWSGSAVLLQTSARGIPVVLLGAYYGAGVAGLFALAVQILALPVVLIGQAVGSVFLGEAANLRRANHGADVVDLLRRTVKAQLALGIPAMVVAVVLAPWLVPVVFGSQWSEAATFLQLLAVMALAQFVAGPVTSMFDVAEQQHLELVTEVVKIVSIAAPIIIAAELGASAQGAVAAASVGGAVAYSVVLLGAYISSVRVSDASADGSIPTATS